MKPVSGENDAPEAGASGSTTLVCELARVREHGEGFPVELRRHTESGRLVVRAFNECGNNYTDVDFADLISWFRAGPGIELLDDAEASTSTGSNASTD